MLCDVCSESLADVSQSIHFGDMRRPGTGDCEHVYRVAVAEADFDEVGSSVVFSNGRIAAEVFVLEHALLLCTSPRENDYHAGHGEERQHCDSSFAR